jgi:UDP-2-acetamido-2,6-beta-L-arabino-hexul-4-ose reductase
VRIVVTGAEGFLGWHLRVLARAHGLADPIALRTDGPTAMIADVLNGADRVVHLAGVNRGSPDDIAIGNFAPARALATAMRQCTIAPKTLVFANSVQAGNGTSYGDSKAGAAGILAEAAQWTGTTFIDLRLPNVFGEHGRPNYNSVVATFCSVLAQGGVPEIHGDRELELLHATDAAALLLVGEAEAKPELCTVRQMASRLSDFAFTYRKAELPELSDRLDVRLFNTYRSHVFAGQPLLRLHRNADARGELVEAVRSYGRGQTYYSSTAPSITRGEHFHLAKVERFVVLRGEAEIRLRRVLYRDVMRLRVSGTDPVAIDMPTMWAHSITNVGSGELLTLFWSNDLFDPTRPDTFAEKVLPP